MNRPILCILCVLGLTTATLSGCGSNAKVEANTTTVGRELQDLDDARNKGLITEQEYQQKRKEIMKSK